MKSTPAGELMEKVLESVDRIGIKNTLELIQKGDLYFEDELRIKYRFFVESICELFCITENNLFSSRQLINRTDALAVLFYSLKNKCKMKPSTISHKTKKHLSQISRGITRIENLDPKIPDQKKLQEKLFILESLYTNKFQG